MRRVNKLVTVLLVILALLIWFQGWWNGARPGEAWFGGEPSHVAYPRAWATALSIAACVGWVLVMLTDAFSFGESCCRKCRYILKGLSAPRCPECREPI